MKIVKKIFLMLFVFFVGILTVNAESKNIKVTDVIVKEKSTTIEVADPVISDNEITSNITFNQVNDYVTFELTLKNNESEKYKITSITDNNTNENLEVEYDYPEDFISSGDEAKVRVKLTYKNKLTNENISLDNLTITFNVENVKGETSQIVLNPNTGDNILHFLVLLIIAITGLILIVRKKKIKIGALVLAIGLIIIPFAVLAEEKFEINFKFSNIEVKGEFETYNVTVDKGNGTEPIVIPVTYGEKIGELPDAPTKEGHTFVGWIDEQNREVTEDTVITGPLNITPVYKKDKHRLTITHPEYLNEGDVSGQYEYGTQITLTAIERDGFTFSKWSDDVTENPRTITIGTTDITIEPIYTKNGPTTATFKNGRSVNATIRRMSGETGVYQYGSAGFWVFSKAEGTPDISSFTEDNIVSTDDSDTPIYMWRDNNFSYWINYWTEADEVYFNEDSSYMFSNLANFHSIRINDINSSKVTNMSYMFSNTGVASIGFDGFDTKKVTDMSGMFYSNKWMLELDLSMFDTSKVENMSYMFAHCEILGSVENGLKGLNISNWDTSNVTNMAGMFQGIKHDLKKLDLSHFNTSKVTNMSLMFYEMEELEYLNVSNFDTSKVTNMAFMFGRCPLLTELNLSSFDTRIVTTMKCMFEYDRALKTIYASDNFVAKSITTSEGYQNMFRNCSSLVGGRGTKWTEYYTYIRIDQGNICYPGYFTNIIDEYLIEFNPNGGTVVTESAYISAGEKVTILPNAFRKGYRFIGWYTAETGGTEITNGSEIEDDITLYAHWEEADEKLFYYSDNGDGIVSIGDLVRIGDDDFYVIEEPSNGKLKLLSKNKLDSNYRQSEDNYIKLNYSDSDYWNLYAMSSSSGEDEEVILTEFNSDKYGNYNIYRDKNNRDTDNNLKDYINQYRAHLEEDIVYTEILDARVMYYEEAIGLICSTNGEICDSKYSEEDYWDGGYWLGSINDRYQSNATIGDSIWNISTKLEYSGSNNERGIRPLIEVNANEITSYTYKINFDTRENIDVDSKYIIKGASIGKLPEIKAPRGKIFDGWYTEEEGGTEVSTLMTPQANITLYAHYKNLDEYTITFNPNQGMIDVESLVYYEGETFNNLPIPTRKNCLFLGWYTEEEGGTEITSQMAPDSSMILYAHYRIFDEYTITFNPNQGTVNVESLTVQEGNAIGSLPTPTYVGYEFLGWYTEIENGEKITNETVPTKTTTYYAHWKENKNSNITYVDLDNSEGISIGDSVTIEQDEFFVVGIDKENIKLLAKYNLDSNYRQSNSNFGTSFTSNEYWYFDGCAMTSSSNDQCGYEFDENSFKNEDNPNGLTYYIYRDIDNNDTDNNIYTYIDNYKSYLENDLEIEDIQDVRLMSYTEVLNAGCEDDNCPEWIRNQNYWLGSVPYEDSRVWYIAPELLYQGVATVEHRYGIRPLVEISGRQISSFNISFDSQGGEEVPSKIIAACSEIGDLPNLERDGYEFLGWYTDLSYTTKIDSTTRVYGNKTYYAKWLELHSYGAYEYGDMDGDNTINLGDIVKIENEYFWVLSAPEDEKVRLLAKYNIDGTNRQKENADKYLVFASSMYWWDSSNNNIKDTYYAKLSSIPSREYYVYRNNLNEDTPNNLKRYVNNYKEYLVSLGADDIADARLMSDEEAREIGCTPNANTCPEYIANQSYWLGSVYISLSSNSVSGGYGQIDSENKRLRNQICQGLDCTTRDQNGIRVLVEIPVSAITG